MLIDPAPIDVTKRVPRTLLTAISALCAPTAAFASGNFGSLIIEMLIVAVLVGLVFGAFVGLANRSISEQYRSRTLMAVIPFALIVFGIYFALFGGRWVAVFEPFFWLLLACFLAAAWLAFAICKRLQA